MEAVELINEENPDLIFFTGDLVNNHASEAAPFVEVYSKSSKLNMANMQF